MTEMNCPRCTTPCRKLYNVSTIIQPNTAQYIEDFTDSRMILNDVCIRCATELLRAG